ncbi:aldolase/citrate lyase family protein, partial [Sphingomonas bacterium]|uniref:aldolase/citrate lyase family protein n=1 Tax=Sphingomonas bacterium TaxID=1895847 RepID=UPI0020C5C98F
MTRLRSLLFVPGDRPERFAKAAASGADALILDLEDSVVPARKAAARAAVAAFLRVRHPHPSAGFAGSLPLPAGEGDRREAPVGEGDPLRFVRVSPLGSPFIDADLAALADVRPDGLVLPKAEGAR